MIIAYLKTKTFKGGFVPGAEHYYGEIAFPHVPAEEDPERPGSKVIRFPRIDGRPHTIPSIKVMHPLSEEEASSLNRKMRRTYGDEDLATYKAGRMNTSFWDKESLKKAAIEVATRMGIDVLMDGGNSTIDPRRVLLHPDPNVMLLMNGIYQRAEEEDYWGEESSWDETEDVRKEIDLVWRPFAKGLDEAEEAAFEAGEYDKFWFRDEYDDYPDDEDSDVGPLINPDK